MYWNVVSSGAISPAFAPARALYEQAGFSPCGPFAGYVDQSFSAYFSRAL